MKFELIVPRFKGGAIPIRFETTAYRKTEGLKNTAINLLDVRTSPMVHYTYAFGKRDMGTISILLLQL